MRFNTAKPFIYEFITCIGVIISIILLSCLNGEIRIIYNNDIPTLIAIILVVIWFLFTFVRVVSWGVAALIDYLFQNVKEIECVFLDITPYRASIFSDKSRNEPRSFGMYYLIQVKIDNKIYTLVSPFYLDLIRGNNYLIKYGKFSKIICEIEKKENLSCWDAVS